ncbi:family 78 glycoside hydrolase catalytic domain [Microlunatus parietis]|uniref:alpha-L-rhamnosidase n=1 Tax=Microlunatus parietis TaxID=682979 RepID=A0A7Y9I9U0_9ACTN|nr:family 78 glycoside hydrolase catalytic domain [Microlunatus parietis]NYE72621.1 alpha-L-rhamnosidase [Microlunatus parietis]
MINSDPEEQRDDPPAHGAHWITAPAWRADPAGPLPVLGTVFHCAATPVSAVLRIAGLGVFSASINDGAASADLLEPGYTDYAQRAEFCRYDVTHLITPGDNVIMIELGPGLYRSQRLDDRWTKIKTEYGELAACASLTLEYQDRPATTVITGIDWGATVGQTRSSNWTGGEDFDAGLPLDASVDGIPGWPRAVIAAVPPRLRLSAKTTPPLRVREVLDPVELRTVAPGAQVIDFGVNFAGWAEVDLPPGARVKLRPAELLHPDGTIDPRTEGWDPVYHTVAAGARPLTWHPRFCYNGLRYLEISGLDSPLGAENVRGLVISADARSAGDFACSDDKITALHTIIRRAVTSNMFSVFTDCPHREKLNFLEELHLAFPVLRWNYDVLAILANTLRLIREAQGQDGHLPLYVPEWDPFPDPWRGDVNWGGAVIMLPWLLHRAYADESVLRDNEEAMGRYARHLLDSRVDGLIRYGDWDGREFRAVPLVSTATLARLLGVLADALDRLGRLADAALWRNEARLVTERVRSEFWNDHDLTVGGDTLGELAIAARYGIVPPGRVADVVDRLERRIIDDGYVADVGEVGLPALLELLAEHDRHETIFRFARQEERPGYGFQLRHGATSLTETWDGPTYGISQNHFMLGAIDDWFFAHLAGLQQAPGDVGFRELIIRPRPCGGIDWARASYRTERGNFAVEWRIDGDAFRLQAAIPDGSACLIETPDGHRQRVGGGTHLITRPATVEATR